MKDEHKTLNYINGTTLRSGRVTLKKNIFVNLYFLVTNVFGVSNLIVSYLNMPSIDLTTLFKIGTFMSNREKRYLRDQHI